MSSTFYVQYMSKEGVRFVARVQKGACEYLFREGVERHEFGPNVRRLERAPKVESNKLSSPGETA
jgi:hypothetical protein